MRLRSGLSLGLLALLSSAIAFATLGRPEPPAPPLQPGQSWVPVSDTFGYVVQESVVSSSTATRIQFIDGKLERSASPAPGAQSKTVLVATGMLRKDGRWHHVYAALPTDALPPQGLQ